MNEILADVWNFLFYGGILAFTFGFVVFVHELGHFLMARWRGVGVEAFAVGMGPKMFAWRRGPTEYSIRWLPVGGFVALHQPVREEADADAKEERWREMEAEAEAAERRLEEEVAREEGIPASPAGKEKKGSVVESTFADLAPLYDKGLLTKLLVFGGGVTFNFITAMLALTLLYTVGVPVPKPFETRLAYLAPGSPMETAGLAEGDVIVEVEGRPVADTNEFYAKLGEAEKAGELEDGMLLKAKRGDAFVEASVPLPPPDDKAAGEAFAETYSWPVAPHIGGVVPLGPADKAGIREGDLIVAVNGEPIELWAEMAEIVRSSLGKEIAMTVRREGAEDFETRLVPVEDALRPGRGQIQIVQGAPDPDVLRENFAVALAKSPVRAALQLHAIVHQTIDFASRVSFKKFSENVGGPIMILTVTQRRARAGFVSWLDWLITFNLLLAFMNLLPIPILDGGFIVLSFIEAAMGRPVPRRILEPVFTVFFVAFIALFALISLQDITRFF